MSAVIIGGSGKNNVIKCVVNHHGDERLKVIEMTKEENKLMIKIFVGALIWGHRTLRSRMAVLLCWLFCFALFGSCDGDDSSSAPVTQPTGDGQVYYVSPSGNDANSGDQANPWRTIQHAADSVLSGDTVSIRAGTYAEAVLLTVSGAQNQWITFMAAPDEDVTIQSLQINEGVSFLNISYLTVQGFSVWGIDLAGNNHDIILSHLRIIGGEAGVHFTRGTSGVSPENGPVSLITLEQSLIQGAEYTAVDCTPGPCDSMTFRKFEIANAGRSGESFYGADGLAVERGRDILVEDCFIHDNSGDGIDLNSRDFSGNVYGIVVRRNRVVRNRQNGIKLWGGGRIENNILWGQGNTPVVIGDYPGSYDVVNNTIAYNMWDTSYSERNYAFVAAYPENGSSSRITLTMRNNIFAFNCREALGGPTGLYLGAGVQLASEGYNLFWSREDEEILAEFVPGEQEFSRTAILDGTWATATGQGQGNRAADPLFVAGWPDVDVHLRANSPAVDHGDATDAPSDDLAGNPRPQGDAWDIGAYEQ
jgi:hypothetical protein